MDSFTKSIKKLLKPSHVNKLNEICEECNFICTTIKFQRNFENWTSGNNNIDKFIQDTQLSVHVNYEVYKKALEWIPYDRFNNIEKSSFDNKVYKANWIDGYICEWDDEKQNWKRNNNNMIVTLKRINNLKKITLNFMNEV
uniref:Uncharacterized protein n=1 Tax=Rhizophagus irregularis (strain DAOM 181602 / DAOM 197198 / MUCL 43194) TaxID=747089 RepID=U9SU25_RHIID